MFDRVMAAETLRDLVWKMECKGFDTFEIHYWISGIWCIVAPLNFGDPDHLSAHKKYFDIALAQAHVEIDFTNYKKNRYVKKE